jgi:hypothetical protein
MPPGDDGAGPIRIPPPMDTPPGAYCPFFISPVMPIIDPSCALISAISFFGPFIRRCMPSRISALDGGSSVRGPAVNTIPLVHPATYTRTESLGTGLVVSCAAGAAMDETAIATAKAALMTADLTASCWLVVPECRPRQGSVQRLFDSYAVPSGGQASAFNYAVTADGQRFLVARVLRRGDYQPRRNPLTVILNWPALLGPGGLQE